jgi:hypothetical protein
MAPVIVVIAIGVALIAGLVVRHGRGSVLWRDLAIVGAVALGVRLVALTIIQLIAIRTHGEGTWLSDEAAYWLAAESLLPFPFDRPVLTGEGHLGGNAYLGVLTAVATIVGHMDSVAFRLTNATLGTLVALTIALVAAATIGKRAALVAGIAVAFWPTMVLWSATFLRDTLGSFTVVALWWMLVNSRRLGRPRVAAAAVLAVVLLAGSRPYLAGAVATGVLAWAALPWLARQSRRSLVLGAGSVLALGLVAAILQARHIDQAAHQLVYRQMTTRLETLGLLNYDVNPSGPPIEQPFGPGAPVALVDQRSGWLDAGLVREPIGPGLVTASFMDGSIREERIADLVLLQSAPLSPVQLVVSMGPGLLSFLTGAPNGGDSSNLVWIADALAWDVLFVLAILGGRRARVPLREWLYPACVVLGTVAALVSVPGAPGNDDRHRATQTVPLLIVFAAGLLASRPRTVELPGRAVSNATNNPTSAPTAAVSRRRSPR